jgi:hypothetical protein
LGVPWLLDIRRHFPMEPPTADRDGGSTASAVPWDVLRTLRGQVTEVIAYAEHEEVNSSTTLVLAGSFQRGGLFQVTVLPALGLSAWDLEVVGSRGRAKLVFEGDGAARLSWDQDGQLMKESWDGWSPWHAIIEAFETQINARRLHFGSASADQPDAPGTDHPNWEDAIRCLELDDAVGRSVRQRRASTLEYQEATEEVGFKGTMTLVGCALLWGLVVLLILSRWFPRLGWVILPLIVLFLALQVLRWVVPRKSR